jgi:aldehyde:ferredoxin oxidoreductase
MESKILVADLNKGTVYEQKLTPEQEKDVGGRLLGLSLYREYAKDSNSPLVFATTPTNASNLDILVSGRTTLVGYSPLIDKPYSSNSGGKFGRALAVQGYSALVILGESKEEVYIDVDKKEITRVAPDKRTITYGDGAKVGCLYAALFDGHRGVYGRGGFGKVFVDKRLQGVSYEVRDPTEMTEAEETFLDEQDEFLKTRIGHKEIRTFQDQFPGAIMFGLGIERNFKPTSLESQGITKLVDQLYEENASRRRPDISEHVQVTTSGKATYIDDEGIERTVKGPHNQSAVILGTNLGIYDLNLIYSLFDRCHAGLDTLSFGGLVGAVMDMATGGHLTTEQMDGIDCTFKTFKEERPDYDPSRDNYTTAVTLLRKIFDQDDQTRFTNALRKGVTKFTEEYSHPEYAMQVKGLSFSAYNITKHQELALLFATSSRGPDHFRGGGLMQMDGETIAEKVYNLERNGIVCDILGIDRFTRIIDNMDLIKSFAKMYGVNLIPERFKHLTPEKIRSVKELGLDVVAREFGRLAEKTMTLERMMLLESTGGDSKDNLPERILEEMNQEVVPEGGTTFKESFERNRAEYYDFMGFDKQGVPTAESIASLGIMEREQAQIWYGRMTERK